MNEIAVDYWCQVCQVFDKVRHDHDSEQRIAALEAENAALKTKLDEAQPFVDRLPTVAKMKAERDAAIDALDCIFAHTFQENVFEWVDPMIVERMVCWLFDELESDLQSWREMERMIGEMLDNDCVVSEIGRDANDADFYFEVTRVNKYGGYEGEGAGRYAKTLPEAVKAAYEEVMKDAV